MLLYKQHRLHCEGVSFVIPDGYSLDTSPEDVQQDTLNLWRNGRNLHITVGIERETQGPMEELLGFIRGMAASVQVQPEPIQLGGMSGCLALYHTDKRVYCEYRLHLSGEGTNQTEFLFLITAPAQDHLLILNSHREILAAFDIRYDRPHRT